mgnify:CR=1 FL=1
MELMQLNYFMEVATSQHVTKSAERLHIAQPALTQAIHRLEAELGVPLFVHKGRNIRLTAYGAYFLKMLRPILQELNFLPLELKAMAKLEDSTIHLNVLAASALVTQAVIEYKKTHPNLHIQFTQNEESDVYDICITTVFPGKENFQKEKTSSVELFICQEKIFLAVPNLPRFEKKSEISLKDMEKEKFIALSGSRQLRSICDTYCKNAGIQREIVFESDSPSSVMNAISARMGVGFWPAFSWKRPDPRSILLLEVQKPVCSRDIAITYTRTKKDDIHVRLFYEFLCGYFKVYSGKQDFQSLMSKSN